MKFSYSQHAVEQMNKRGISEKEVQKTINSPERIIQEEDYVVYQRMQDSQTIKYLIRVFINMAKKPPLVITVYRTSKISKYYEDKI